MTMMASPVLAANQASGAGAPAAASGAAGAQGGTPAKPGAVAPKPKGPLPHFEIDDFAVRGETLLTQLELEAAIYPFLGPNKTAEDVEKARAALEKAYHDKGYQTVSVSVPAQNVNNHVVVLQVTELKVGRLRVKNSRYFDVNQIKRKASALAEGTVPNFNDVTKDIVSLNQWPDRKVTPTLRAGVTPGTVDVDLNVDDTVPLHGSVELNDRQSPNTTPLRFTTSVDYDNLWQLGHSLTFTYQVAPERPSDAIVYSGSYLARLPDIDWLSFLAYGVDSQSNVAAVGGLDVVGPGQIVGGRAVITLPSAPNLFHTLSVGVDYKSFGETVGLNSGDSSSSFSSPVTYYPVVASYTAKYQKDSFSSQLTASLTDNLRPLSSDWVAFDNRRAYASANFTHVNIDVSATEDLKSQFQLYGRIQAQAASGPLVSSEQMSVGGFDTVRGYLESETLGDEGAVGSFEVRTPNIGDLLQKSLAKAAPAAAAAKGSAATAATPASAPVTFFDEWRFFGFVDAGMDKVIDPLPEQQSQFELWSYGVGTSFKVLDHFNGMVALAVPMISQANTQAHDPRVDFRIWSQF